MDTGISARPRRGTQEWPFSQNICQFLSKRTFHSLNTRMRVEFWPWNSRNFSLLLRMCLTVARNLTGWGTEWKIGINVSKSICRSWERKRPQYYVGTWTFVIRKSTSHAPKVTKGLLGLQLRRGTVLQSFWRTDGWTLSGTFIHKKWSIRGGAWGQEVEQRISDGDWITLWSIRRPWLWWRTQQ